MIELWRRWHISLSEYLRDIFFTPFLLFLTRLPIKISIIHLTCFAAFITFILNGLWHGLTINFLISGILNGLGVVIVHYYDFWIKKLPKPMKIFLNTNRYVHYIYTTITFFYLSVVCSLFTVNPKNLSIIWESLF